MIFTTAATNYGSLFMWVEKLDWNCWNGSLDLLCLSGFGIGNCIAVGVMLPAALGVIHSCAF